MNHLVVNAIVTDRAGNEYRIDKIMRVNVNVTRLSDGAKLRGPYNMFTFLRMGDAPEIDESLRLGAIVTVDGSKIRSSKWNYDADQKFVIFGGNTTEFKVVELGGNPTGAYWKLPADTLEISGL